MKRTPPLLPLHCYSYYVVLLFYNQLLATNPASQVANLLPDGWHMCYLGSHEQACGRVVHGSEELVGRVMEEPAGSITTGLFGYLLHRRAVEKLLGRGGVFPLRWQVDVAISKIDLPAGSRFTVGAESPLVRSPKSEEGACDTDVQILGPRGVQAHRSMPKGMMLL